MSETVKEMENRWAALMAAKYGPDSRFAGQRVYEHDEQYAREVLALGVQIDGLKKAERSKPPQINQAQLDWLARAQGARDKNGKLLTENPVYAKNLRSAREHAFAGGDISRVIENTERVLAEQKATLPTPIARPTTTYRDLEGNILGDAHIMPPAIDVTAAPAQATVTFTGRG